MSDPRDISPERFVVDLDVSDQNGLAIDDDGHWYLLEHDEPSEVLGDVESALRDIDRLPQRFEEPKAAWSAPRPDASGVALMDASSWSVGAWRWLDDQRDGLRERWSSLIIVGRGHDLSQAARVAPNAFAFFTDGVGRWSDGAMSQEEIDAHVVALRARSTLSDKELLRTMAGGSHRPDIDDAVRLVLLGRGDLLRRPGGQ